MNDDNYDDLMICHECFADNDIQQYVFSTGKQVDSCCVCGINNIAVHTKDKTLVRMIRALIRYHFPEYEYNPHWGGEENPSRTLSNPNLILRVPQFASKEKKEIFEFVVETMTGGIDTGHEIPLYKRSITGDRDLFAFSLKSEGSPFLRELKNQLENSNYNELYAAYNKSLESVFEASTTVILKSAVLYRARVGFSVHREKHEFLDRYIEKKIPYSGPDIAAPPPKVATPGRANREGISYYYLASDIDTAVAEVRPDPGHYVTVGQFDLLSDLKVVDFVNCDLVQFSESEEKFMTFVTLKEISHEFQKPITRDQVNRYLKSQFFADVARNLGYDGISFNSSIATGTNLVVFQKDKLKESSSKPLLFAIQKQSYTKRKVGYIRDGFIDDFVEILED